jgi:hypothetical protein
LNNKKAADFPSFDNTKSCIYCYDIQKTGKYIVGPCQDLTGKSEKWYIRHAVFNDPMDIDQRSYIHHISEENAKKIGLEE